jgi:hypothetical protein
VYEWKVLLIRRQYFQDFLNRGLLLTRKLLNQGFLLATTKDRVTWTPLKTGGELRYSGRVSSSCSSSGTRRGNLVTNPVICHEWGKWNISMVICDTDIPYRSTKYIVVCPFTIFLLAIVLSVLLRFRVLDYPFRIFKLFFPFTLHAIELQAFSSLMTFRF